MSERPWLKFYTRDWQSDRQLRMCSMAARGLWIELICIMHDAKPYGHLLVNGQPPTDAQLGVLVGAPPDHLPEMLRELETAGVFSRTRAGVIYSRRMTRDEKKARTARQTGKKGGNPSLRKQTGKQSSDNAPEKGQEKPQRPEARVNPFPDGKGMTEADLKKRVYDRGREILGDSAGGQITKLVKACGTYDQTLKTLEQAADAAYPSEYVGRIVKEAGTNAERMNAAFDRLDAEVKAGTG